MKQLHLWSLGPIIPVLPTPALQWTSHGPGSLLSVYWLDRALKEVVKCIHLDSLYWRNADINGQSIALSNVIGNMECVSYMLLSSKSIDMSNPSLLTSWFALLLVNTDLPKGKQWLKSYLVTSMSCRRVLAFSGAERSGQEVHWGSVSVSKSNKGANYKLQ